MHHKGADSLPFHYQEMVQLSLFAQEFYFTDHQSGLCIAGCTEAGETTVVTITGFTVSAVTEDELSPTASKIQYAGNMGFAFFQCRDRITGNVISGKPDILLGFIPKYIRQRRPK